MWLYIKDLVPGQIEVFNWSCSRESNPGAAVRVKFTLVLAEEFCAFLVPLSTKVCLGSFASPCVKGLSFIPFVVFYPSVLWCRCFLLFLMNHHPPLVVVILSWKNSSLLQVLWFSLFRYWLIACGSYRPWLLLQVRDLALLSFLDS